MLTLVLRSDTTDFSPLPEHPRGALRGDGKIQIRPRHGLYPYDGPGEGDPRLRSRLLPYVRPVPREFCPRPAPAGFHGRRLHHPEGHKAHGEEAREDHRSL